MGVSKIVLSDKTDSPRERCLLTQLLPVLHTRKFKECFVGNTCTMDCKPAGLGTRHFSAHLTNDATNNLYRNRCKSDVYKCKDIELK